MSDEGFASAIPLRYTRYRQPVVGDEVIAALAAEKEWEGLLDPAVSVKLEAGREHCSCYTCCRKTSCGSVTLRLGPMNDAEHTEERYENIRRCVAKNEIARPLFDATPLHAALALGASDAAVLAILKARPKDAQKASSGLLPLHLALESPNKKLKASTKIALLAAYPQAAKVQYTEFDPGHPVGGTALHCAVYQNQEYLVIQALLSVDPTAASVLDRRGSLPIHVALKLGCSDAVISALVSAFPQAATVPYPWPLALPVTDCHCNPIFLDEEPISFVKTTAIPDDTVSNGTPKNSKDQNSSPRILIPHSSADNVVQSTLSPTAPRRVLSAVLSSPSLLVAALLLSRPAYGNLRCAGKRGRAVAAVLDRRLAAISILKACPDAALALTESSHMTSLHIAALVGAPVAVVKGLVSALNNRDKARGSHDFRDSNKHLPVHIAILRAAPARILDALLRVK